MGQFKQISVILDQIAEDSNVHPSIREAMRDLVVNKTIQSQPFMEVYVLLCDGVVTDVFIDKAMAEYDLHTCIKADEEEGLPHKWTIVIRQLNTTML